MQKITPCLWFDGQAEDAAAFYASVFPNSRIVSVSRYGDAGPGRKGSVMTVRFRLAGQDFMALNGGPQFEFSPAISLVVNCASQKEVDELWRKLSSGGKTVQCGWLEDRYGVSWQVVPTVLEKLVGDGEGERAQRVMRAMLGMVKLDADALERAAGPHAKDGARGRTKARRPAQRAAHR